MCDSRQPDDGAGSEPVVVNGRCSVCGARLPDSRVIRAAHEDPSHRRDSEARGLFMARPDDRLVQ